MYRYHIFSSQTYCRLTVPMESQSFRLYMDVVTYGFLNKILRFLSFNGLDRYGTQEIQYFEFTLLLCCTSCCAEKIVLCVAKLSFET